MKSSDVITIYDLKSLVSTAESIKNYKDSIFEDERQCAESMIDELLEELHKIGIDIDYAETHKLHILGGLKT